VRIIISLTGRKRGEHGNKGGKTFNLLNLAADADLAGQPTLGPLFEKRGKESKRGKKNALKEMKSVG